MRLLDILVDDSCQLMAVIYTKSLHGYYGNFEGRKPAVIVVRHTGWSSRLTAASLGEVRTFSVYDVNQQNIQSTSIPCLLSNTE